MPGHRSMAGTDSIIVQRRLGFLEAEVCFAHLPQGPLWGGSGTSQTSPLRPMASLNPDAKRRPRNGAAVLWLGRPSSR